MKESREVPSDEIDINPDKQKRKSSNTSSSLKKKRKILEKNFKSSFTYSKPNINICCVCRKLARASCSCDNSLRFCSNECYSFHKEIKEKSQLIDYSTNIQNLPCEDCKIIENYVELEKILNRLKKNY